MSDTFKTGRGAERSRMRACFFKRFRKTVKRREETRHWDPLVSARRSNTPRRWL